ncbi:annexin A5-like [Bolinopsis microptera]|uniref:annexin A5-like n=1 Tax=Bolinopsis microptera TaxID=2820187 RepID=UPI003079D6A5
MVTSGTIEGDSNFDAETDANKLRQILKESLEKDISAENNIAQILVQRSNLQRQQIDESFRSLFDVGLCDDMMIVVNKGNYFETVKALLLKPIDYDVECLREAIMEANESVICEMLCTRTHSELTDILTTYESVHESAVKEDLENFIGEHTHLYLSILESPRDRDNTVDDNLVTEHLNKLISAERSRWDLVSNPDVIPILTTNNFAHLRAVFKEFQKRDKGNMEMIESSIRKCLHDEFLSMCLVMWVKSIKNVTRLFSELLYQSVTSLTADSARVIRIVVGRSEIDLNQIKSHYMMQYNKQLQLAVQQKCGNDLAYSTIITMIIKN